MSELKNNIINELRDKYSEKHTDYVGKKKDSAKIPVVISIITILSAIVQLVYSILYGFNLVTLIVASALLVISVGGVTVFRKKIGKFKFTSLVIFLALLALEIVQLVNLLNDISFQQLTTLFVVDIVSVSLSILMCLVGTASLFIDPVNQSSSKVARKLAIVLAAVVTGVSTAASGAALFEGSRHPIYASYGNDLAVYGFEKGSCTKVTIPETVNGKKVTLIEKDAFTRNGNNIKKVYIKGQSVDLNTAFVNSKVTELHFLSDVTPSSVSPSLEKFTGKVYLDQKNYEAIKEYLISSTSSDGYYNLDMNLNCEQFTTPKVYFDTYGYNSYIAPVSVNDRSQIESKIASLTHNVTSYNGKAYRGEAESTTSTYLFDSWCLDADLKTPINNNTNFSESAVLYSKWAPQFKVNYPTKTEIDNQLLAGGTLVNKGVELYSRLDDSVSVGTVTNPAYNFVSYKVKDKNVYSHGSDSSDSQVVRTSELGEINSDIDLTATEGNFTKRKFTITYIIDENVNNSGNPISYVIGGEIIKDPSKIAYDFQGWSYVNLDGVSGGTLTWNTSTKTTTISNTMYGDLELTAKWAPTPYSISYDANGGTFDESSAVNSYDITSDEITLGTPTRNGYTFGGWFVSGGTLNGQTIKSIPTGNYGNMKLTAQWNVVTYSITYYTNVPESSVSAADNSLNDDVTSYNIEKVDNNLFISKPTRHGYKFMGWTYSNEFNVGSLTAKGDGYTFTSGTYGNVSLTANWEVLKNAIHYDLDGSASYYSTAKNNDLNVLEFTVEDAVTLYEPTREGYTFNGWYDANGNRVTSIPRGTYADVSLTARWTINTYAVTVNNSEPLKGTVSVSSSRNFEYCSSATLTATPATGYEFVKFTDENGSSVDATGTYTFTLMDSNRTFDVFWKAHEYSISYDSTLGTLTPTKNTYTIEDADITLESPTAPNGYSFGGWIVSGGSLNGQIITAIQTGSYGDMELTAQWNAITYSITYDKTSYETFGNLVSAYDVQKSVSLGTPAKTGYDFQGWLVSGGSLDGQTIFTIPVGSYGDITLSATWTPTPYSISYDANGGTFDGSSAVNSYNITSDEITLGTPTRNGYTFGGWLVSGGTLNGQTIKSIPTGNYGAMWLIAQWNAITYSITYELNDGTNSDSNSDTYSIEDPLVLSDPTKTGYTFRGWYLNGQKVTSLSYSDGYGDATLIATWEATDYDITYNLNGGTNSSANPAKYTIETNTITLEDPTREGYYFDGWFDDNGNEVTTIVKGSVGNVTLNARWTAIDYTITYELSGGTNNAGNPASYSIDSPVTLLEPTKAGYNFDGWYMNGEKVTSISYVTGQTDVTIVATWSIATYDITYDLGGGTNSDQNPASYTVDTDDIILANPTRTGYDFAGWLDEDGYQVTTIAKGSTGDIKLIAQWDVIEYTITYDLDGGTNNSENPDKYTIESEDIALATPTKEGYEFAGWYNGETPVTSIPKGSTGSITLVAHWTPAQTTNE